MIISLLILILTISSIIAEPPVELFTGKACNPVEKPALIKIYENFNKATVSADFIHKSFVKALNKELLCRGKMVFIPNKGIFWEITSPYKQSLYITKNGEIFEKDSPDPVGVFRYGSLMSEMIHSGTEQLTEAFELYFMENGPDWFLGLKPKKRAMNKFISNIVISGNPEGKIKKVSILSEEIKIAEISFQNHQSPPKEELNRVHEIFNQK
jgi:hypothetical protein